LVTMTELKSFEDFAALSSAHSYPQCPSLEKKMCVVLTAYNDEEAIGDAVKEFASQKNVAQLIVVDNNCSDNTASVAMNAGARVVKEGNQGYGFSCIRGLREALTCEESEIIVLAEGDMTFRGRDIWKLLPFLDDADLVLGSRTHMALIDPDTQMDWFMLWGNLFLAKVLQFRFSTLRFVSRSRFTDVGCTMRAINKEALSRIIDHLEVGGSHFSPNMAKVALREGLRVVEVPITFRKRVGKSKGAGVSKWHAAKIGLHMLWDLIR
jgi:glycosyltransferase involved in cell wall biosynthesis